MSRIRTIAGLTMVSALALGACNNGGVAGATGTSSAGGPASPSASAATRAIIVFQGQGGSNITGGGVLNDLGSGQTAVTLGIVAPGAKDPMPAQLFPGTCASAPTPSAGASGAAGASGSPEASGAAGASGGAAASGAGSSGAAASGAASSPAAGGSAAASGSPAASGAASPSAAASSGPVSADANGVFQLTPVSAGSSNTVVQSTLGDLLSSAHAIAVQKSASDTTNVACADITLTPAIASPAASAQSSGAASPAASAEASGGASGGAGASGAASGSTTP